MVDETDIPDYVLVQRALGGCGEAFTGLFDRYYVRVRAFAFRIMLEYQASDDVAQETFIRAAGKLATIRGDQAFAAWVFRIASNVAKDHLRSGASHQRKLREMPQGAEFHEPALDPPDDPAHRVLHAMHVLPPNQREAVALVFFENCTHAEAAARVGCATATISWRMALAKRALRKFLAP